MRRPHALWLAAFAVALSSCSLQPRLVKHYDVLKEAAPTTSTLTIVTGDDSLPNAAKALDPKTYTLSAFVTPVPPKAPPAPLAVQFSDRAQGEVVRAIAASGQKPEAMLGTMATTSAKAIPDCPAFAPITLEKRVVFALTGRHPLPAWRVDAAVYQLTLADASQARFTSWNRFESQFDTVALGTTRMKQSQSQQSVDVASETTVAAATALAPAKTLLDSLTNTWQRAEELEENVTSSVRIVPLTGTLTHRTAAIIQQSAVGRDLFGNVTADFTIQPSLRPSVTLLSLTGLFDGDTPQTDPTKVVRSWCDRARPFSSEPVLATVEGALTLRMVDANADTAIEGDDTVTYAQISGARTAGLELVSKSDLQWDEFRIGKAGAPRRDLQADGGGAGAARGTLSFSALATAIDTVRWLRETDRSTLFDIALAWPGDPAQPNPKPWESPYTAADAANLVVYRCASDVECAPVWR